MSGINYLTKEGYEKLKAELDEMKTKGRKEVAAAIAEDAQGMLELKISEMEKVLSNSRILDASQLDMSKVTVLSNVLIKNTKTGKTVKYTLVSESEADLKAKKISVNSPIGKGLLGKEVGEIATIETPRGNIDFEVMNISID